MNKINEILKPISEGTRKYLLEKAKSLLTENIRDKLNANDKSEQIKNSLSQAMTAFKDENNQPLILLATILRERSDSFLIWKIRELIFNFIESKLKDMNSSQLIEECQKYNTAIIDSLKEKDLTNLINLTNLSNKEDLF